MMASLDGHEVRMVRWISSPQIKQIALQVPTTYTNQLFHALDILHHWALVKLKQLTLVTGVLIAP